MTTSITFRSLEVLVSKMDLTVGRLSLADRLDDILDRARVNADDTCYTEKTVPVTQYDRAALDTVASILSYTNDPEVCAWFAAQGMEW